METGSLTYRRIAVGGGKRQETDDKASTPDARANSTRPAMPV